ncbi:hypothetical protein EDD21DRAFT_364161 [Dissophora ornata]|nr:hypothetical protein BGZ58_000462 [Dissophora ornata]KAI8605186.1 hypothetical protein EDD21DRAFT_364161 [Dissophora ornata]
MHTPFRATAVLVASLCLLLLATAPVTADSDPIIQTCYNTGCGTVVSLLAPCGGGATNASLQQDLIYTPTASLGGCECNSYFYDNFSSCLACIASQGENSPEIENQQDWVTNCSNYGFNYTATPVTNSTSGSNSDDTNGSSDGGGLSKGAIIGIVIGVVVLLGLVVGSFLFAKSRKSKNGKTEHFDQLTSPGAGAGGATVAAETGTAAALAPDYQNTDYPATYDNQGDYYANQHTGYDDQYQNQAYAQPGDYDQQYTSTDYQNGGYYGMDGQNDAMMMQNMNQDTGYVLPPPPAPSTVAPVAYAAARPSDSFPQSLRNKPKGWDNQNQQDPTSAMDPNDHTYQNDKAEFDDGEELEPPHSRSRFASGDDYTTRRSMTPPRANMQSYRDEFNRPSLEREPRRSGSDLGSAAGLNMARNDNYTDNDQQGDFGPGVRDSPESSRRRARAAELFSAEGTRR